MFSVYTYNKPRFVWGALNSGGQRPREILYYDEHTLNVHVTCQQDAVEYQKSRVTVGVERQSRKERATGTSVNSNGKVDEILALTAARPLEAADLSATEKVQFYGAASLPAGRPCYGHPKRQKINSRRTYAGSSK